MWKPRWFRRLSWLNQLSKSIARIIKFSKKPNIKKSCQRLLVFLETGRSYSHCQYLLYDEGKLTIFLFCIIIGIVSAIFCCVVCCCLQETHHNHNIKSILSEVKRTNETNYNIVIIIHNGISSWSKLQHSTARPPMINKPGRRRKDSVRWLWSPHSCSDWRSTRDRWAGVGPLRVVPVVVVLLRTRPWCRPSVLSTHGQTHIIRTTRQWSGWALRPCSNRRIRPSSRRRRNTTAIKSAVSIRYAVPTCGRRPVELILGKPGVGITFVSKYPRPGEGRMMISYWIHARNRSAFAVKIISFLRFLRTEGIFLPRCWIATLIIVIIKNVKVILVWVK